MTIEQQAMVPHDPIDSFVVGRLSVRPGMLMSQYAPYPTIAIRAESVNDLPNVFRQCGVIGTAACHAAVSPVARTVYQCHEMAARHAKGGRHQSHWSSPGNNGERAIHFAQSTFLLWQNPLLP